jgi:iron complex outermembrane receptor protein
MAMLGANFTQTRLFGDIKAPGKLIADSVTTNTLFGRNQRGRLEHEQPDSKIILLPNYRTNKLRLLVRNTRFGKTGVRPNNPVLNPDENFSPKVLTDLSFSYTPKSWLPFTAGANNIFDVYADRIQNPANTEFGTDIYSKEASPFGFNGGYYFVRIGIQLQKR